MSKLKKYTNFEALKSGTKPGNADQTESNNFSEFKAFLEKLQTAYFNKKKIKADNEKRLSNSI